MKPAFEVVGQMMGPGEETPAFEADILHAGQRVASVRSDGRGGQASIWWVKLDEKATRALTTQWLADEAERIMRAAGEWEASMGDWVKSPDEAALIVIPELLIMGRKRTGRSRWP